MQNGFAAAEPKPRRQRTQRKAVALAVIKNRIAAMKASGEKATWPTLAELANDGGGLR